MRGKKYVTGSTRAATTALDRQEKQDYRSRVRTFRKGRLFQHEHVGNRKKAGVSTGIVYGYFHDKRDILIEVLDIYVDNVFYPVFEMFDKITAPVDFDFIITHSIDNAVTVHENNAAIHEALHSLSSTDKTVRDKFMALENDMTTRFVAKLRSLGYDREDIFERVHLAMETVQSYAHEKVFDKHSYIDYDRMRKIVIDMLVSLFKK